MNFTISGNKLILDNKEYEMPDEVRTFLIEKILRLDDLAEQNEFLMKRDNRCQVLEQVIDKLNKNLVNSIKSINNKLLDKEIRVENGKIVNPINDYRAVRLKGIKIKCKELLDILKEAEGTDINVGRVE